MFLAFVAIFCILLCGVILGTVSYKKNQIAEMRSQTSEFGAKLIMMYVAMLVNSSLASVYSFFAVQ